MTADVSKIPVFMQDTVKIIFKIGCDINLLDTKRKKMIFESNSGGSSSIDGGNESSLLLPNYFAICAQGESQDQGSMQGGGRGGGLVSHTPRELRLEFNLAELTQLQRR